MTRSSQTVTIMERVPLLEDGQLFVFVMKVIVE